MQITVHMYVGTIHSNLPLADVQQAGMHDVITSCEPSVS